MSESNLTVALLHGAFAESASWNGVVERLQAESLHVVAMANPLRSLAGDAQYVRDVIAGIGGPVVLAAHSYGGMVISEAAAGNEAVRALVYACGFAPEQGESAFGLSTKFPGSTLGDALTAYPVSSGGVELVIRQDLFPQQFAADVPAQQTAVMAATQRPATQAALSDALVSAVPGWKTIPSWFIIGEMDRNIPAELQRYMAERASAVGTVEVPGASHAITVSKPEIVASAILEAVRAAAASLAR
jgi:pimeloyl-ACP methyl ester carboxylesterase